MEIRPQIDFTYCMLVLLYCTKQFVIMSKSVIKLNRRKTDCGAAWAVHYPSYYDLVWANEETFPNKSLSYK